MCGGGKVHVHSGANVVHQRETCWLSYKNIIKTAFVWYAASQILWPALDTSNLSVTCSKTRGGADEATTHAHGCKTLLMQGERPVRQVPQELSRDSPRMRRQAPLNVRIPSPCPRACPFKFKRAGSSAPTRAADVHTSTALSDNLQMDALSTAAPHRRRTMRCPRLAHARPALSAQAPPRKQSKHYA